MLNIRQNRWIDIVHAAGFRYNLALAIHTLSRVLEETEKKGDNTKIEF